VRIVWPSGKCGLEAATRSLCDFRRSFATRRYPLDRSSFFGTEEVLHNTASHSFVSITMSNECVSWHGSRPKCESIEVRVIRHRGGSSTVGSQLYGVVGAPDPDSDEVIRTLYNEDVLYDELKLAKPQAASGASWRRIRSR